MSRVVTGGIALLALAAVLLVRSAVVAQSPPVLVPESPPELPGDAAEVSSPHEHSHDHSGHSHNGHTHDTPADRPPTLTPRGSQVAPVAPPYALGPHGGKIVPVGDGHSHVELVYDEAHHAITIYLPPSMGVSAYQADSHGHAVPGVPAAGAISPPALHDDHSYAPYPCPFGRSIEHADEYECEFERRNRGASSHYPTDRVAPYPVRGH